MLYFDTDFMTVLATVGGGLLVLLVILVVFELITGGFFSRHK